MMDRPDVLHMSGFLLQRAALHHRFNRYIVSELEAACSAYLEIGHDLLDRVPTARWILHDPNVTDALTCLLGPGYDLDPCRHVHINDSPEFGPWHQDRYCEAPLPYGTDHGMLLYLPQDTPPEMGPTALMPGAWSPGAQPFDDDDPRAVLLSGPAGTFAVMRLDLWHRATPNTTGRMRYMLKFLFTRR